MKPQKTSVLSSLFALVAISASGATGNAPERAPAGAGGPAAEIEVQLIRPHRGAITRSITLPAEVRPYQQATLYAKVPGYLRTIHVDTGDSVRQGDAIAEIEVPEISADLARYKAEAQVAGLDYKRLSDSQKKAPDLVTPQSVDEARGKVEVARANIARTEALLQYSRLAAPFSGVITRRLVDPGAFIPAATSGNAAQNAAVVTLTDFERVRVQMAIPEVESSLVSTGQPARLTLEALPGRTFDGTITRFAYALDEASKTMLAEVEMPNPEKLLRPGMYATVRIGIERKEGALLLPAGAVGAEKAGPFVFTIEEGKASKRRIKTGFRDGVNVEILSGVAPDQPIILPGERALVDGQRIAVREAK